MTSCRDLLARANAAPGDGAVPAALDGDRIWPETNCYADLWLTLAERMGIAPIAAFGAALGADFHGGQWTFLKPDPADLRAVLGFDVAELAVWRSVADHTERALADGDLLTVEVDSWWLPDTRATDYRTNHVKTTIVPLTLDRAAGHCVYVHNRTVAELHGDDFTGIFGTGAGGGTIGLPPYVELIRYRPELRERGAAGRAVAAHLARRPGRNPAVDLMAAAADACDRLRGAPTARFHAWAFVTLRQAGATAELAADLCRAGESGLPNAAAPAFEEAARAAKSVQFAMSRLTRGRTVDVTAAGHRLTAAYADAFAALDHPYRAAA